MAIINVYMMKGQRKMRKNPGKFLYQCDRCNKEFWIEVHELPAQLTLKNPENTDHPKQYELCGDCAKVLESFMTQTTDDMHGQGHVHWEDKRPLQPGTPVNICKLPGCMKNCYLGHSYCCRDHENLHNELLYTSVEDKNRLLREGHAPHC